MRLKQRPYVQRGPALRCRSAAYQVIQPSKVGALRRWLPQSLLGIGFNQGQDTSVDWNPYRPQSRPYSNFTHHVSAIGTASEFEVVTEESKVSDASDYTADCFCSADVNGPIKLSLSPSKSKVVSGGSWHQCPKVCEIVRPLRFACHANSSCFVEASSFFEQQADYTQWEVTINNTRWLDCFRYRLS